MKFSYSGFDQSGKKVSGTVEAPDTRDATESLRKRGIYATSVGEESRASPSRRTKSAGSAGTRMKLVANFAREMSVLVSTGTPVVEAIASLERQATRPAWKATLTDLRENVEEGAQLSDAMLRHPSYFDGVCRSLIAAGEQGGRLEVMLDRLAKLTRQQVKIRTNVAGAMVYPCLLLGVSACVVCAMFGFVLPRFEGLFKTLGAPLPASTQILVDAGQVAREYWWQLILGIASVVGAFIWWARSASGKSARDVFVMRAPGVAKMFQCFATARLTRILGTLLDGKVPLLEALKLTRSATGNMLYAAMLSRAEDAVIRGDSLSATFSDSGLINPSVCEAIRSGEKNGRVASVLVSISDHLDEDNEVALRTLTGLIEPLILIVLGLVVGGVAVSLFMPLFDLTATGGAQGGAS